MAAVRGVTTEDGLNKALDAVAVAAGYGMRDKYCDALKTDPQKISRRLSAHKLTLREAGCGLF